MPISMREQCEAATAGGEVAAMLAMLAPDVEWCDEQGRVRSDGHGADAVAATIRRRRAEGVLAGARLERWEPQGGDQVSVVVRLGSAERKAYLLTLRDGKIVRVQDQPVSIGHVPG